MKNLLVFGLILLGFGFTLPPSNNYPIDGYDRTGIRRLLYQEEVLEGKIKGKLNLPDGALFPLSYVQLNLVDQNANRVTGLPETTPDLQAKIESLFNGMNPNYSITVLDITDGRPIQYASLREEKGYQPGSVGKLVILAAFFTELSKIYPDDFDARIELLKNKMVKGGSWAVHDHHTVPFFNPETQKYYHRQINEKDIFSLYEWLDNMVSPSNNGAASTVWRETLLMHVFGKDYPSLTYDQGEGYFNSQKKSDLSEMAITVVNQPLRDLGITKDEWRLGSFFTGGASAHIPGKGGSIGTPKGLMKYCIALERGEIVDRQTSLEMKRLIYMTGRRIRYAASPKLKEAAVYFKSGSLYSCGGSGPCGKYAGNSSNFMNSVAIVEHPSGSKYIVCLMSNVLHKNSAYDHLELANKIDDIMQSDL